MSRTVPIAAIAGVVLTAGCSHTVPGLTLDGKYNSSPTVESIVNQVSCELKAADARSGGRLAADNYLILVQMTLQVDDTAGFAPSLSYINPLTESRSFTGTLGADLNGQRRRTYTTTYSIEASAMANAPPPVCPAPDAPPAERLYSLRGDLGINEIVEDGLRSKSLGGGIIAGPRTETDKAMPTFGSQVQFVITRAITAFGPVWSLHHFKGPSAGNGLLNGKQVYTDSVILTFTPQYRKPGASQATVDARARAAELKSRASQLETDLKAARSAAQARARAPRARPDELQLQMQLLDVPGMERSQATLAAEVARAEDEVRRSEQLDAEQDIRARDAAAQAAQNQLTSILLQNLQFGH